jgi:deoxyribodipyrimidine photolyase-related protein
MSDYPRGAWTRIWDGLFWRFILKHKDLVSKNPRMKMLLGYLKKNRKEIDEKIAESREKIKWLKS